MEIMEWNSLCLTDPFHLVGRPRLRLVQSHRYLVLRDKVQSLTLAENISANQLFFNQNSTE